MSMNFRAARGAEESLREIAQDPDRLDDLDERLDLDKSWHIFHYLFTGTADGGAAPANALLLGGEEIGDDLGYGPVRVLGPAESAAFARFLSALSPEELLSRLDMTRMSAANIYCASDDDDWAEEIAERFPELRDFVAETARQGSALLLWIE